MDRCARARVDARLFGLLGEAGCRGYGSWLMRRGGSGGG